MKEIVIFGNGGHARALRAILPPGRRVLHVLAEARAPEGAITDEAFFRDVARYRELDVYLGIGSDPVRRRLFERLVGAGITPATAVADCARISPDATVGSGAFLGPFAMAGAQARIGRNVIVNTRATVDHDCVVGDHAQLAASVTLGGGTEVGSEAFLDLGVVTLPRVRIGEGARVMAGSVVVRDVDPWILVGGNPARPLRRVVR